MKIIEVPIFNEDGSIQTTQTYSPEEAQRLLQFAANFMMGVGNAAIQQGNVQEIKQELND